jgi:hypothetical protein
MLGVSPERGALFHARRDAALLLQHKCSMPQLGLSVLGKVIQDIEFIGLSVSTRCGPAVKAALRSMNAAKILQHRLQQTGPPRSPGSGPAHRKFHCVFKDSSGK